MKIRLKKQKDELNINSTLGRYIGNLNSLVKYAKKKNRTRYHPLQQLPSTY